MLGAGADESKVWKEVDPFSQAEGAGRPGAVMAMHGLVAGQCDGHSDGAICSGPVISFPVQVINYCWP